MPLAPTWADIGARLFLTLAAGAIVGFNRGARGHAAGFRTTILVGVAAAVAMCQANLLLSMTGKTSESFSVMDLMRLPLGILTGVGFIGGGTILKKGDLVTGVTTAATLWLMTVIGLCFGGGQLSLGVAATALAVFTLWVLKACEGVIRRQRRARIVIRDRHDWQVPAEVSRLVAPFGCSARLRRQESTEDPGDSDFTFEITWRALQIDPPATDWLVSLGERYAVRRVKFLADSDQP